LEVASGAANKAPSKMKLVIRSALVILVVAGFFDNFLRDLH
jgi:hypothetical protein